MEFSIIIYSVNMSIIAEWAVARERLKSNLQNSILFIVRQSLKKILCQKGFRIISNMLASDPVSKMNFSHSTTTFKLFNISSYFFFSLLLIQSANDMRHNWKQQNVLIPFCMHTSILAFHFSLCFIFFHFIFIFIKKFCRAYKMPTIWCKHQKSFVICA